MNLANLDRLIVAMETARPDRFRMDNYFGSGWCSLGDVPSQQRTSNPAACGTAACLAGWCQLVGARTPEEIGMSAFLFGAIWLDIDEDEAGYLFLGEWSGKDLGEITLGEALAHLRTLRTIHLGDTRAECRELLEEHVSRYGGVFRDLAA